MTPRLQRSLLRILPFGAIWFLTSVVFMITDQTASAGLPQPASAITPTPAILLFAILATTCIGFIVGTLEVLVVAKRFQETSLVRKLSFKFLIYGGLLMLVILVTFPIAAMMEMDTTVNDPLVWERLLAFLGSVFFLTTALQLSVSLLVSLLYSAISEHLGPMMLFNLVTGRYHEPQDEQRVFMFLDMNQSTAIAEKLGHSQYFRFLQAYYEAMSEAIIEHLGEVYQYIGDEVVISWRLDRGLQEGRCVKAFFAIRDAFRERESQFKEEFGVAPGFKAAIHLGPVTAGEIGALKRQIVFTGDVLNTTSRLQGLCAEMGVDLIVSEEMISGCVNADFEIDDLGKVQLRGREEEMKVYAVKG